jgi:hypothetical protein
MALPLARHDRHGVGLPTKVIIARARRRHDDAQAGDKAREEKNRRSSKEQASRDESRGGALGAPAIDATKGIENASQ